MAQMTEEQMKQMTEQMKQQTEQAKAKKKQDMEAKHPEVVEQKKQEEDKAKDDQIKELKKELAKSQRQAVDAQQKQEQAETNKTNRNAHKAMDSVLRGHDSYFEKDYDYPVNKGDNFKFHVKMHSPNALEIGKISNEVVRLAQADASEDEEINVEDLPYITQSIYQAIAYFKYVGDEVPEEFKHPEQIYRYEIPVEVMQDFLDWDETFRNSRRI